MPLCPSCEQMPADVVANFMESKTLPESVVAFLAEHRVDTGCGQLTTLTCVRCAAVYQVEIDVEPFTWDFSISRQKPPAS